MTLLTLAGIHELLDLSDDVQTLGSPHSQQHPVQASQKEEERRKIKLDEQDTEYMEPQQRADDEFFALLSVKDIDLSNKKFTSDALLAEFTLRKLTLSEGML